MYRCIHCGGFTGETMQEAQEATGHGVGVCVSPCRYCNEGVPHAPHVCSNGPDDQGRMPPMVRDFVRRQTERR